MVDVPCVMVTPVNRKDCVGVIVALITPDVDVFRGELSWMMVPSEMMGLLVPAPLIVVWPCNVIPFVMFVRRVQLNVPIGSVIVSHSDAISCNAATFAADPSES